MSVGKSWLNVEEQVDRTGDHPPIGCHVDILLAGNNHPQSLKNTD